MGPGDGGVVGEGEEEPERGAGAFVAGGKGMSRSEEAGVSEEAVRRRGGGGGPRELGMSQDGEAEEPVCNAGESAAGRERSEPNFCHRSRWLRGKLGKR